MTRASDETDGSIPEPSPAPSADPVSVAAPPAPGRAAFRRIGVAGLFVAALAVGLFAVTIWQGRDTCPGCASLGPPASSPAVGVVVGVDAQGLGRVRGFTLRSEGVTYSFVLGALENETEFTPSHLSEHMATSQPIRVFFRPEDGVGVVYRLEDASE